MSDLKTEYQAFVAKLFNRNAGDLSKDFSHAVMGITTEIFELLNATDEVNAIEEGGDLGFFHVALDIVVADALAAAGLDPLDGAVQAHLDAMNEALAGEDPADTMNRYVVDLLDHAKRWVGYGSMPKPPDWPVISAKARVACTLAIALSSVADVPKDRIVKANIAKLSKRYPGGEFDALRAVVRDTEAERAAVAQA